MADPKKGTAMGGQVAVEKTLEDGVPRGSIRNRAVSYTVWTDGSTVFADPQADGLPVFSGSDVGPVLDDAIAALPSSDTDYEARGKIVMKQYDSAYPGDLANGRYDGLVVPAGLTIEAEAMAMPPGAPGRMPAQSAEGVLLNSSSNGIVPPNVESNRPEWGVVRGLVIDGPGLTSGTAIDTRVSDADSFGVTFLDRVMFHNFQKSVFSNSVHGLWLNEVQFENVKYTNIKGGSGTKLRFDHCWFYDDNKGSRIWVEASGDGRIIFNDCLARMNPADTSKNASSSFTSDGGAAFSTNSTGNLIISDLYLGNYGNEGFGVRTRGSGTGVDFDGLFLTNNWGQTNNEPTIGFTANGEHKVSRVRDNSSNSNGSVLLNACSDIEFGDGNEFPNGIVQRNNPQRIDWRGTLHGGPLGGTDIGSLTGASPGDQAMSDGTTATNADTLWILKSNGDWQRVDGGATITPA